MKIVTNGKKYRLHHENAYGQKFFRPDPNAPIDSLGWDWETESLEEARAELVKWEESQKDDIWTEVE